MKRTPKVIVGALELAYRMGYIDRDDEIVRRKDCARSATCFTYRETGDGEGFCKWAERRPKTP